MSGSRAVRACVHGACRTGSVLHPMVPRLLSNICVATPFYQLPAFHVYSFLRNLLYIISDSLSI